MKISVEKTACQLHGDCVMVAPEVFDFDEDGAAFVTTEDPPVGARERVWLAVKSCPVSAITASE